MEIKIKKLSSSAITPTKSNESDAGYDLYATRDMVIGPMERAVVSTDISIEIPEGYYGRVAPRSGLAVRNGIDVVAGVIDSGYRDAIGVVIINLNLPEVLFNKTKNMTAYESAFGARNKFTICKGDRVAQLIIERCHNAQWVETELSESERGMGGFGSSGD
jgi:dUTP pyrophosphatase